MKTGAIRTIIDGVLEEIMMKTHSDVVVIDENGTSLSSKLAEIITAINLRAKSEDVTIEINEAITSAINELIGSAPDTYNTLQDIAEYIEAHQEVVDAINAAIGAKVDRDEFDALEAAVDVLKGTYEELGALSSKDTVAESDLDAALVEKINLGASGGTVVVSATEPENMTVGDLWFQIEE